MLAAHRLSHAMPTACSVHQSCGLAEYVASLLARSRLSKSVFVYSLIYANKFVELRLAQDCKDTCKQMRDRAAKVPTCAHCMFLGSLMIAFKFTHDNVYKIKYWAEWSNLDIPAIVKLELATLEALNYELMVSQSEFDSWAHAYSEQSSLPGHTSLYSAIVLYFLVVRRLSSERRPSSTFDCYQTPASRRDSADSLFSSNGLTPKGSPYDVDQHKTPEMGILTPPQTPSPHEPPTAIYNTAVVHITGEPRLLPVEYSVHQLCSSAMLSQQQHNQQRHGYRFAPYIRQGVPTHLHHYSQV